MSRIILIGVAGLIGTVLRYGLAAFVSRQSGETFPWGTLVVNIVGCLIAGAVFHLTEASNATLRTVILVGLLGGFTTFSAYGLQTFTLIKDGAIGLATLNVVVSNVVGLVMVWIGYIVAKAF
jgi:CrcB protein